MVCSFRLALFSFIEVSKPSGSWDELVVIGVMGRWEMVRGRLGSVLGGWFGARNRGKRRFGFGGKVVTVPCCGSGLNGMFGEEATLALVLWPNKVQVGFVCTMAEIGCNWARIGPSKSSQSLSIAHKWAVEID
ncbi:hypothetical protein Tco_0879969 [Tanacetum coccineum]